MRILFRGVVIAFVVAFLLVILTAAAAHAQGWNAAVTSGLTSVESLLQDGVYTWTLWNNSSLPADAYPTFDILVWELVPYQVREPLYSVAPEGWVWVGDRFRIADLSKKYYTPYALAPGGSFTFTYAPDADGRTVNAGGPQPDVLGFIAHVGAVIPESGTSDGSVRWQGALTAGWGETWHDRPAVSFLGGGGDPVPEPKGLVVLAVGLVSVGLLLGRIRPSGA